MRWDKDLIGLYKGFLGLKKSSYESPVVPTDARKFAASKRLV